MNQKYYLYRQSASLTPFLFLLFLAFTASSSSATETQDSEPVTKTVIAANGGGEGVLTNTLPAIVLASTLDFDYIELPLVVTGDSSLLVYPSITLDPFTDVADHFPDRIRDDGHYYVIDFSLTEIRQLRKSTEQGNPLPQPALGIPTLDETLALLTVIDKKNDKKTKLAPRLINPSFHTAAQKDISRLTLMLLKKFGFGSTADTVLLQCANGDELQRIKRELMPALNMRFPLMQRIEQNPAEEDADTNSPEPYDHSWMFTRLGLRVVSSYADILALHSSYLQENALPPTYLEDVRALGMQLFTFPVTYKSVSSTETPENKLKSFAAKLDHYLSDLAMDGIISSDPDSILTYLAQKEEERLREREEKKTDSILNINLQPLSTQERSKSRIILHTSTTP